jgi:YfiH family protein
LTDGPEVLRAAALAGAPHGFLGRRGGSSHGIHEGLNVGLGSDDSPSVVAANRRLAGDAVLPGAALVTVFQFHSPEVLTVTEPPAGDERPRADAMVTATPGLLLGILTADCAPVLFHDPRAGVVGAAHAGWKGALAGVTDATIAAMEALGAHRTDIAAAIGPCIAQPSYEVDEAFVARFGSDNARFFSPGRAGHAQFDLEGYVAHRLEAAGIGSVTRLGEDTYAQEDRFYSYRRATHRGEADYGRQISLIGLPAA